MSDQASPQDDENRGTCWCCDSWLDDQGNCPSRQPCCALS